MVLCPKCGKEIPDDSTHCDHCGAVIKEGKKRTGYPKWMPDAGGILAIISACLCAIFAVIVGILSSFSMYWSVVYGGYNMIYLYFVELSGLIGFAFGLAGGILILKRTRFVLAIVGICLTIVSSDIVGFFAPYVLFVLPFGLTDYYWLFGFPTLIISLLSLIFTAISKEEFS